MAGIVAQTINAIVQDPIGAVLLFGIGLIIAFIIRFMQYGI